MAVGLQGKGCVFQAVDGMPPARRHALKARGAVREAAVAARRRGRQLGLPGALDIRLLPGCAAALQGGPGRQHRLMLSMHMRSLLQH